MQAAPSPQQTSVRVENVTSLKGLIQEIESQTSYRISYQGNLADNVPVKIAKSTKSVSQLLDEALRGTGITYIIRQNNIIPTRGGTYGYGHVSAVQSYVRQHRELEKYNRDHFQTDWHTFLRF